MPDSLPFSGNGFPLCSRQGEFAILCDAASASGAASGSGASTPADPDIQRMIWALAARMTSYPDVIDAVPGMNNLLVVFGRIPDLDACQAFVNRIWAGGPPAATPGREIIVPVVYGGDAGEDLLHVARHAGLSPRDYAKRHAQGIYTVYALGSQPGFAYLGGLDPALAVPRRETPRPRVQAGAVIIGGTQAGVLSRTTPSGWHIIGKTTLESFDPAREPPALFAPGDTVRFDVLEILE